MGVSNVDKAGPRDQYAFIDGTAIRLPGTLYPRRSLRIATSQTLAGRARIDAWYDGVGLPDQPDHYDFDLRWDLSDDYSTELLALETLAASGGSHTFTYWKKILVRYTATSGQTVFYLPRPDAFSKGYTGHLVQATDGATVKVNGTPIATVNYVTPVTSGTVVTAGQVSISNTAVSHPDSGYTVALFKFGTALVAGDIVTVEFTPLFNVGVTMIDTNPFTGDNPGREDKVLSLVEMN